MADGRYSQLASGSIQAVLDGRRRDLSPRERELYEEVAFAIDELRELARRRGAHYVCPCTATEE